jgi:hypothetical protein
LVPTGADAIQTHDHAHTGLLKALGAFLRCDPISLSRGMLVRTLSALDGCKGQRPPLTEWEVEARADEIIREVVVSDATEGDAEEAPDAEDVD